MEDTKKQGPGAVVHFSAFILDPEGKAVDMVMTDPKSQFAYLLHRINSGEQPATEDFKERINAYNP